MLDKEVGALKREGALNPLQTVKIAVCLENFVRRKICLIRYRNIHCLFYVWNKGILIMSFQYF